MNILLLETEASRLRISLLKKISHREKLFHLYLFFDLLLKYDSHNAVESYLLEFTSQYCSVISNVSFRGVDPAVVNAVLTQLQRVIELYPEEDKDIINNSIIYLQKEYHYLLSVLNGSNKTTPVKRMVLPLLEKGSISFEGDYGYLSTLSVKLTPRSDESKFHIIPGRGEPDSELKQQADNSLTNALRIAGNYVKVKHRFWDVYIDFENKSGEYSGSSFGMLLVVKLVQELLSYYDSPVKIFSYSASAVTGAVDEKGNIASLSTEIIAQKTKTVFYSDTEAFILPEDDLPEAKHALSKLNAEYPGRHLKLTGIHSIDDLFNLRNVVGLKKESALLRSAKFVKKQGVSIILLILLAVIIYFSGILDFDDNPDHFEYKGKVGFVMNKNGKKLAEIALRKDFDESFWKGTIRTTSITFDINGDGTNEIVLCQAYQILKNKGEFNHDIICYDNKLNILWKTAFTKTISTNYETHTNTYDDFFVDTMTVNDTLFLICVARNTPNEASAVFKLDCKNGKISDQVLWHSGHLLSGDILKINGKPRLYFTGINNGFGRSILFSINSDEIKGQLPSKSEYRFLNVGNAKTDEYILLPKSDYTRFFDTRYNRPFMGGMYIDKDKRLIQFFLMEGSDDSNFVGIGYVFDENLKLLSISLSDDLIKRRDALIKSGKLKGPLTRTKEFEQSLISQLRYWNGTRFVTADERFNTH